MGSAGHARGAAAGRDVAGKLYAGGATTSVVPLSGLKTEDLTPCLAQNGACNRRRRPGRSSYKARNSAPCKPAVRHP
jgi:hypothetical protein